MGISVKRFCLENRKRKHCLLRGFLRVNSSFLRLLVGDGAGMDFFEGFSDDQIALFGCFGALLFCGALVLLSSLVRNLGRRTAPKSGSGNHFVETIDATSRPSDDDTIDRLQRRAA